MHEEIIRVSGLTKAYAKHIGIKAAPSIEDLYFTVQRGEIYGFLGRNGAGKTTTIKILCGLIRATRGEARVNGVDVRKREARKYIGYLPENPYFYEYLNPRETVEFYGKLRGLNKSERARTWDRLSEQLDLRDIADRRVRGFSKGMRQRLGFAVALVGDPEVLILDEPMSGLDPMGRRTIRELILELKRAGKTIFFSSHVLGDVQQISDRVGILANGCMRAEGSLAELLGNRVSAVEVIARGLPKDVEDALCTRFIRNRQSEDGIHLFANDVREANELAREILANSGDVIELTPLKESLEEFFMREESREEAVS